MTPPGRARPAIDTGGFACTAAACTITHYNSFNQPAHHPGAFCPAADPGTPRTPTRPREENRIVNTHGAAGGGGGGPWPPCPLTTSSPLFISVVTFGVSAAAFPGRAPAPTLRRPAPPGPCIIATARSLCILPGRELTCTLPAVVTGARLSWPGEREGSRSAPDHMRLGPGPASQARDGAFIYWSHFTLSKPRKVAFPAPRPRLPCPGRGGVRTLLGWQDPRAGDTPNTTALGGAH